MRNILLIITSVMICVSVVYACENLLNNPSFEDGFNGWRFADAACCQRGGLYTLHIDDTMAIHGNKSVKVVGLKATGTAWHARVEQRGLSMQEGKTFSVSFWAFAPQRKTVTLIISTNNNVIQPLFSVRYTLPLEEWKEYHFTFTAPENSDDLSVSIGVARNSNVLWLDNFRYYEGLPHGTKEDINKDSIINILDLVLVASRLGETGDAVEHLDPGENGVVDILDLVLISNKLGETVCWQ